MCAIVHKGDPTAFDMKSLSPVRKKNQKKNQKKFKKLIEFEEKITFSNFFFFFEFLFSRSLVSAVRESQSGFPRSPRQIQGNQKK